MWLTGLCKWWKGGFSWSPQGREQPFVIWRCSFGKDLLLKAKKTFERQWVIWGAGSICGKYGHFCLAFGLKYAIKFHVWNVKYFAKGSNQSCFWKLFWKEMFVLEQVSKQKPFSVLLSDITQVIPGYSAGSGLDKATFLIIQNLLGGGCRCFPTLKRLGASIAVAVHREKP